MRDDLSDLERLVMIPANHMSRYKNLEIEDEIRSKILGKLKAHKIGTYIKAGSPSKQKLIESASKQTSNFNCLAKTDSVRYQSNSPLANDILQKYNFTLPTYRRLKQDQVKNGWSDSEFREILQGTTRSLGTGRHANLYTKEHMSQLQANDSSVVDDKRSIIKESFKQGAQAQFSTNRRLKFKRWEVDSDDEEKLATAFDN